MSHLKTLGLKISAIAAAALLASCAEKAIKDLEKAPKEGREFAIALAKEYLNLAKKESRIYNDMIDARHFAMKGMEANTGREVLPEDLKDWDIAANDRPMIEDGRSRLMFALDMGGRMVEPELGAKTQVFFDCMVEEYEEGMNLHGKQSKEMAVCHKGFWDHLAKFETALAKFGPVRNVMFDYNSANLEHDAMVTIKEVAQRVKQFKDRRVMLVGHTDPIGKAGYNRNLSYKRVMAVKDALVKHGVHPGDIVVTNARGELKTSKRELEPNNRSVGIYFM